MNRLKLTIELVPSSSFYNNVRSHVDKKNWDRIRKKSYRLANYRCEICNDVGMNQGVKHPVECHEIWSYDDSNNIQRLEGMVSLCPNCHKTKHVGLSASRGELPKVINQLCKVNGMTPDEAGDYIEQSFDIWKKRSKKKWYLDLTLLDLY